MRSKRSTATYIVTGVADLQHSYADPDPAPHLSDTLCVSIDPPGLYLESTGLHL